ncbi:MAG TPA: hypothetical protein VGD62_06285 [Acidobacteriaceae bacterium]
MAEPQGSTPDHEQHPALADTLLIAHVTVHLLTGENFELYPFVDAKDVKAKVSELVDGWHSSGFLLRGSRLYPWHQVRLLETTSVEEITRQEAQQRLLAWKAEDELRAVQSFWKTKEEKKDGEGKEGKDEKKE